MFLPYLLLLCSLITNCAVWAYYSSIKCYGTGDCLISLAYLDGGFSDEYHRWLVECSDGEAMVGIYDNYYFALTQIWCHFSFPLKPPSLGIYPFYPSCNVRNLTLSEYYCYDKYYPVDTVDTFVTGFFSEVLSGAFYPYLMKCCKTPTNYKLDYMRCEWKYTHDKQGEPYDAVGLVKCDTNFVMTGMGQALNPWDNNFHWVWIQCCPLVTVPTIQPTRQTYGPIPQHNYLSSG